jgi:uncharacterized protein YdcH (DUF465 family)
LPATESQRPSPSWLESSLLEPVCQEVRMPDTEALIERLTQENHEFRKLHDEHRKYDEELAALNGRGFLSPDQQWRVSELKKLKLIAKDRMEVILRHARATMHA